MNSYFYANVNKFTLQAIVDAFALNIKLPNALMQTGFPNGVIVSFSPKGIVSKLALEFQNITNSVIHYVELIFTS